MGEWVLPVIAVAVILGVIYVAVKETDSGAIYRVEPSRTACPMCGTERPDGAEACECGYVFQTDAQSEAGSVSSAAVNRPVADPGSGWSVWGWIMTLGGLGGLVVGLFMKMSVETYTPSSILGPGGSSDVVNLGLMFNKGVVVACSLSAIGLGVFCFAVGAVLRAIGGR